MEPARLARSNTEHAHQVALFAWMTMASVHGFAAADDPLSYTKKGHVAKAYGTKDAVPELKWAFAIPNGGSRGNDKRSAQIVGAQMKAEGVKAGVSDIFLPIPRHNLCGLFIELKRPDGGAGLSPKQLEFGTFVRTQRFGFVECLGWEAAADIVRRWFLQRKHRS